jgi:tetratricopeptide (TPR) repeat protein
MKRPNANTFTLLALLIPSVVYLSTICPTVYLGDSGELTAAAFSLGIPHNSGYPLYALLGKLFCLIPFGSIAFRMNLMSSFFGLLTLWLLYSFILKITSSRAAAFVGALFTAFTPAFWLQTVPAEVYTLHTFFVALILRILWWWDEKREFYALVLFVFITGLSFGNHMQTVMLAPAVLFIVITGDKKALFNIKNFILLSVFFVVALLIYLYLPLRTEAGAAIHWGDPDNLERFLAHVTGSTHREGYALNRTPLEYFHRTNETLWLVGSQFGVILILAFWGWVKFPSVRWRIFCLLVIIFDFGYTIFLNFISLEVTAFGLPTSVLLAILSGLGVGQAIKACERSSRIGLATKKLVKGACYVLPAIPLFLNYGFCDQAQNYTAYEHALNIFRTTNQGSILILDGDNNFFPVLYGRIVERMRGDVILYDRHDILFKMPYLGDQKGYFYGTWENLRRQLEKHIIQETAPIDIYYAVFAPDSISMPGGYVMVPYGMLHRVLKKEKPVDSHRVRDLWRYYSSESFYDDFEKDFMNRQVHAHFYFTRGQYLFMAEQPALGLRYFKNASHIGDDGTMIHSTIANFLMRQGLFEEARQELVKASTHHTDLSVVHNNWGSYYYHIGDYEKAINALREAIQMRPERFVYYKHLAFALYKSGRGKEALEAFKKSLQINEDQTEIRDFIKKHGLGNITEE